MKIFNLISKVGSYTILNIAKLGNIILFAGKALWHCFKPPFYPNLIAKQILQIGYFMQ